MEIQQAEVFNALMRSLNTIQSAKAQFHFLTAGGSTPAMLVSQIELCDVLLDEIRGISSSLETRIRRRDITGQRSVLRRTKGGRKYPAVSEDNPEDPSK